MTSRGANALDTDHKKLSPEHSIANSYSYFKEKLEAASADNLSEFKPLQPLFEKVEEQFSLFDVDSNHETAFRVVKWCLDNDMTQQGYTALEEGIKTFFCNYYNLDQMSEMDRDSIVGHTMTSLRYAKMKKLPLETSEDRVRFFSSYISDKSDLTDRQMIAIRHIILNTPIELVTLISKIKDERNDINHFGMRKKPDKSGDLKKKLEKNYKEWMKYYEEYLAVGNEHIKFEQI